MFTGPAPLDWVHAYPVCYRKEHSDVAVSFPAARPSPSARLPRFARDDKAGGTGRA